MVVGRIRPSESLFYYDVANGRDYDYYNDIASDDLISRDGQTIDANSTEERIYYDFGETCKLLISCDLKVSGQVMLHEKRSAMHLNTANLDCSMNSRLCIIGM